MSCATAASVVTFFVNKAFATGRLRFGVEPRSPIGEIDRDPVLSTGPKGEFIRRKSKSFYFAQPRPIGTVEMQRPNTVASMPFLESLKPDGSARGWAFLASMGLGVLLIFLGLSVVATKGPQGWVQVILGVLLIAVPIVLTAHERQKIRQREDFERAERAEADEQRRQMLGTYLAALEKLRERRDDEALAEVGRQRQNLDLPYEAWAPVARRAVLDLSFENLALFTPSRGEELSRSVDRLGTAVGLLPGDIHAVKQELVATAIWHLLADDRFGEPQRELVRSLEGAMGLADADLPLEEHAARQFAHLRGLTPSTLEKTNCTVPLQFGENCFHVARATELQPRRVREKDATVEKLMPGQTFSLFVTSRRLVLEGRKPGDIPLTKIDDIEVDVDGKSMTIRTAKPLAPLVLQVDDPIFTAGIIELALDAEPRPRSFA